MPLLDKTISMASAGFWKGLGWSGEADNLRYESFQIAPKEHQNKGVFPPFLLKADIPT